MYTRVTIWAIVFFTLSTPLFSQSKGHTLPDHRPDQLVIKWKNPSKIEQNLKTLKHQIKVLDAKPIRNNITEARSEPSILDHIYLLNIDPETNILARCDSLNQLADVAYAEPIYYDRPLHIPSDPAAQPASNQYYLENIKAYQAWDISKGNPSITVGVLDTGSDLDHEDLADNYAINELEIENGLDDDNNGYIDDLLGYDFANNDTDVTADNDLHGTRVAGIIGATTNNGIGVAGMGYQSKIVPLKIFKSENNQSSGSADAIKYAADNGYDVINLSYGGVGIYSQFIQDIITYAVLEKDVVVVAAAGNTPDDLPFYPAAYEHVLSVAALDQDDTKASFATYHASVDLAAPGVGIYAPQNNNSYGLDNGSSYASPLVAGTAALLRAYYPTLNAIEIGDRLKASTDNIYHLTGNESYKGKLGTGRLNAYKALTADYLIDLTTSLDSIIQPGSQVFFNDTISFYITITNELKPVFTLNADMISTSPYVVPLERTHPIGYLASDQSISVGPFSFMIAQNTPADTHLPLVIEITDEDRYTGFHAIDFYTGPSLITLSNDSVSISVSADGNIGYNETSYQSGQGFSYLNQLSKDLGFYVHFNDSILMDNLPEIKGTGKASNDFRALTTVKPYSKQATSYSFSQFEDTLSQVHVENYTIVWDSLPGKAIGMIYRISNQSEDTIQNIKSGLYSDFDTQIPQANFGVIMGDSLSYIADSLGTFLGIKVLADSSYYSLLDQNNSSDTLTEETKIALINSQSPDSIGFIDNTNTAIFGNSHHASLVPGASVSFDVIIAAGDSLEQLQIEIQNAMNRLIAFKQQPLLDTTYFSCEGGALYLIPVTNINHYFYSDPLGQDTLAFNDSLFVDQITSDTIIYISRANGSFTEGIRSLEIKLLKDIADFEFVSDTVFLGDYANNRIEITDQSFEPIDWIWDFGNGSQAIGIQNPKPIYTDTGTYVINLMVENAQGCTDDISKTLIVLERPNPPSSRTYGYCPDENIEIITEQSLSYYPFENSNSPLFEGNNYTLGVLTSDTTVYITRKVNGIESKKSSVNFVKNPTALNLEFQPNLDSINGFWANFQFEENYISQVEWKLDTLAPIVSYPATFEIQNDTLDLHYRVTTDSACQVNASQQIILAPSLVPDIDDVEICLGTDLLIAPENGTLFGFYADSLFNEPLHKGTDFKIDSLTENKTIYIAGLDSILPSTPIPFHASVVDYSFDIISSQDTLYMNLNRSIDFSISAESETLIWFIDSIQQTIGPEPTFFFNEPGQYTIIANGTHPAGCQYADSMAIIVIEEYIEPLNLSEDLIRITPVPASHELIILNESSVDISQIQLFDLSGRRYDPQLIENRVSISNLSDGVFILELTLQTGQKIRLKGIKQTDIK